MGKTSSHVFRLLVGVLTNLNIRSFIVARFLRNSKRPNPVYIHTSLIARRERKQEEVVN